MTAEIRIPELGESITEGVIVRWLKRDGAPVRVDDPVLELETDKATVEIPATASGRLQIVEREGATVRVGAVVARIAEGTERTDGIGDARDTKPYDEEPPRAGARVESRQRARPEKSDDAVPRRVAERAAERVEAPPEERAPEETAPERTAPAKAPATPAQRTAPGQVAREKARPRRAEPEEGEPGDGPDEDAAVAEPAAVPTSKRARRVTGEEGDEVERTPMSRLRRRIAERLVEAQRTAAILTTFNEIDLSRLLDARRRHRERFRERHGVDLGLVSLFGRACMLALADVPILNARIDGDHVVHHRRVHLGIAVSTSRGLVVPVVRDADRMALAELERAIEDLARRARDGKLMPEHLAGGTFTITNGGVFGSLLSTPILNPPQAGILGLHKIEERPVAVDGQVVIRPMMYVALSYDHRLVDGEQAVTFLVRVKERLEDPVRMLFEV